MPHGVVLALYTKRPGLSLHTDKLIDIGKSCRSSNSILCVSFRSLMTFLHRTQCRSVSSDPS